MKAGLDQIIVRLHDTCFPYRIIGLRCSRDANKYGKIIWKDSKEWRNGAELNTGGGAIGTQPLPGAEVYTGGGAIWT